MSGAPLRRRQGFLSWLTVLIVLTGSLSWVPVFAGDMPESPDPSLSSVSLSCLTPSSTISGSLSVADPAESVVISVALQAGDNVLDTTEVILNAGQTSYDLTFDLEGGDLALGSSVRAVATFVSGGSSIESATRSIGEYQGAVVCVPDGGLPSVPTVEPSPEPTQPPPSPIPTTTPSPSPEPGASVTPSPEPTGVPSATPTTPATGTGTVVNTAGANLNCRATPATGTIVAKLPAGSTVSVTGATQNGWVPVTCGGQAGWVSAQYLSIAAGGTASPTPTTPPTSSSYVTVTGTGGDNLRCRTAPVSGATITLLAPGTRLQALGANQNGWTPIVCGGQNGWASAAYLTADGSSPTTPTPTQTPGSGTGTYVTVEGTGGAGLRCRTAPSTGIVITILGDGTRVQTRGVNSNGWIPVLCAGQNGYISASYVTVAVPAGSVELWFDVNLSSQYMRVYRGNAVIMQTYVSTGKNGFLTPTGTFYINRKLVTRTMTGVLGGEYYNVPNVPWVMYFTNVGHAIHGAYWHNAFGTRRSHGCINLPVPFSEQLYRITPIGTRLRIHY